MSGYLTLLGVVCALSPLCASAFRGTTRPTITGDFLQPTVTLNVGDNFTLLCEGEFQLEWHVTAPGPRERISSSVTKEEVTLEGNTNKKASRLNLTNAQFYDTGRYSCYNKEEQREDEDTSSVYIFVKDPSHALVPYGKEPLPMMIPMLQYRQTVIPCLVTDPSINVTLIKQAGQDIVNKRSDVIYDPKRGFTLMYPNLYFHGVFYCEADTENHTDSITVVLQYRRQTTPFPYIIPSATQVMVGEVFSLTCFVTVDVGEGVRIGWEFKNKAIKENYVLMKTVRERVETNSYAYDNVSREMKVFDAEIDDGGVYTCRAHVNDHNNIVSQTVNVYDKMIVSLLSGKNVVETTVGSRVILPVTVNAFPLPKLNWYFNGELIRDDRIYKQKQTVGKAILQIISPTSRQSGNYTLKAHTRDMNASTSILVKVFEPIEVSLTSSQDYKFFTFNKTYNLVCDTSGYPAGDIVWYYQECVSELCPVKENGWTVLRWLNKTVSNILPVVANNSGHYRCSGYNNFGGETKDFKFIVTDQEASLKGLSIVPSNPKVVKGDKLQLQCHASLWQFRSAHFSHLSNTTLPPGRTEVIHSMTKYSLLTTILFHEVLPEDEGDYICSGNNFTEGTQSDTYRLVLEAVINPYPMDQTRGEFWVKEKSSFSMKCSFGGFPIPKISWFKDGHKLSLNNTMTLSTTDASLKLVIKKANESDAGLYHCEGENNGGKVRSTNITLHIGQQDTSGGFTGAHIAIVVAVIVIIMIIIIIIIVRKMKSRKRYNEVHENENRMQLQPAHKRADDNIYKQFPNSPIT